MCSSIEYPDVQASKKDFERNSVKENPSEIEGKKQTPLSSGLRRRPVPATSAEDRAHEPTETDHSSPVKLDASAHAHIEKHRYLILQSRPLSIAWQAQVLPMYEQRQYTQRVQRLHA
ncbi:hypothetical protein TanjilG_26101 [Lupinus angustifolius]|uniref:Uncharacterized protein n=1 Tax=Lupinus angustifolius TaxID=3871 RepID=A0A4P1R1V1_LUPAN|nr:hypothetical protein TanjilG_26101 [Lupinus angustifolius]